MFTEEQIFAAVVPSLRQFNQIARFIVHTMRCRSNMATVGISVALLLLSVIGRFISGGAVAITALLLLFTLPKAWFKNRLVAERKIQEMKTKLMKGAAAAVSSDKKTQ
jgi:hypothetical protein